MGRRSRESGVSLVELLIATTIISTAALGIFGMLPVAHQHLRTGGDVTKATDLAQRMVESLRDQPLHFVPRFHNADTRLLDTCPADEPASTPPFLGGSAIAQWKTEIAGQQPGEGLPRGWGRIEVGSLDRGLLVITVTVGWLESAAEQRVALVTYLGQP